MRRRCAWLRVALAVAFGTVTAACSLLVDTGGLGGTPPVSEGGLEGGGTPIDGASPVGDASDAAPQCTPDINFATDGKNCGVCGHDCLGGTCISGKCQPLIMATLGGFPWYMTADDDALFVISFDQPFNPPPTTGRIVRVDKKTKGMHVLASSESPAPFDIKVNAQHVYWTNGEATTNSTLRRRSKDPNVGDTITLSTPGGYGTELVLTPNRIYIGGWETSAVYSIPYTGGPGVKLTNALYRAEGLAYDGTTVFVGSQNEVASQRHQLVAIDPTTDIPTVRNTSAWGRRLAVAGDLIVGVSQTHDVVLVNKGQEAAPRVFTTPTTNGYGQPAYDGRDIYWSNRDGGVIYRSAGPQFASFEPLVTGLKEPVALVVDDRAIYWTDGAGAIGMLAK